VIDSVMASGCPISGSWQALRKRNRGKLPYRLTGQMEILLKIFLRSSRTYALQITDSNAGAVQLTGVVPVDTNFK